MIEILLVEDNPGDIRLTTEAFKDGKIRNHLSIVTDGEQALDFVYRRGVFKDAPRPDLVLLDFNLPKKDGREVLAMVKADPLLRTIPIVVLTSSQHERDIVQAYDNHANAFITKPVDYEQFLSVVRSIENFWLEVVKLPAFHS